MVGSPARGCQGANGIPRRSVGEGVASDYVVTALRFGTCDGLTECYTGLAARGGAALHGRDLISIADMSPQELDHVVQTAMALKDAGPRPILTGRTLALVFEKPSLRTRVSFHVAMRQLGGDCIYLSPPEAGL